MYGVSIIFKNSSISQTFYYKAFKAADDCYKKVKKVLVNPVSLSEELYHIEIEDEFGTTGSYVVSSIAATCMVDIEKDSNRNGDIEIIRAKSVIRTQKLAKSDPTLRMLNTTGKEPSLQLQN